MNNRFGANFDCVAATVARRPGRAAAFVKDRAANGCDRVLGANAARWAERSRAGARPASLVAMAAVYRVNCPIDIDHGGGW